MTFGEHLQQVRIHVDLSHVLWKSLHKVSNGFQIIISQLRFEKVFDMIRVYRFLLSSHNDECNMWVKISHIIKRNAACFLRM